MDNKRVIEITDEIIWLFEDAIIKELSGKYKSLGKNEVRILLSWIRSAMYKKVALEEDD